MMWNLILVAGVNFEVTRVTDDTCLVEVGSGFIGKNRNSHVFWGLNHIHNLYIPI